MHQSSSFDLEKFPNHSNCGFIVIFGHGLACLSPFLQALITPILKIGNSHLGRRKNRPILMLDLEKFCSNFNILRNHFIISNYTRAVYDNIQMLKLKKSPDIEEN